MRTRVVLCGVALAASLSAPRVARAQDDDDDAAAPTPAGDDDDGAKPPPPPEDPAAKDRAKAFMAAGDALMIKGDGLLKKKKLDKAREQYERALEAYQRAYDTFPSPKIYWLIGRAEQKLGKHLDALHHFQKVIAEEQNLSQELKTKIEADMDESKPQVVTLTFKVEPPGAHITVDDDEIGTAPIDEPVYIAEGKHTIAITFEGYSPFEEEVDFEAGQSSEREVTLEEIPVVVKKPKKKKPKAVPTVSKGPLVAGIVVTGGLSSVALITGLMAVGKHGTFTDESADPDARESARSSGKNLALITDLLWLGAIGAGSYTAYYYYKVYKPKKARLERELSGQEEQPEARWLVPWADRNGGGVAWGGSF
jgi:tetratricopeptide (TPR) repeat protein